MKLYYNPDPSMRAVRFFEEKSVTGGWHSVIKVASRYAEDFGLHLKLEFPEPMNVTDDDKEVNGKKVKGCVAKACQEVRVKVKEEKWQGKRICYRWEDVHSEHLSASCKRAGKWRHSPKVLRLDSQVKKWPLHCHGKDPSKDLYHRFAPCDAFKCEESL